MHVSSIFSHGRVSKGRARCRTTPKRLFSLYSQQTENCPRARCNRLAATGVAPVAGSVQASQPPMDGGAVDAQPARQLGDIVAAFAELAAQCLIVYLPAAGESF